MNKIFFLFFFIFSLLIFTGCKEETNKTVLDEPEQQTIEAESSEVDTANIESKQSTEEKNNIEQSTDINHTQSTEEKNNIEQSTDIPEIDLSECLTQIKQTNPEMSEQDARDNCYTIEAVNKNDKSLCDKVSEALRANCLGLFQ